MDLLCFFFGLVFAMPLCVCLYVPCGQLLGKGWPLSSRLWCIIVSLSLSHWYPGLGVVLDCIDSWSLHPYLLLWIGTKPFIFYIVRSFDEVPCPLGQTSDSMTVLTSRLIYWWDGRGLSFGCLSGPPGFTCWISFAAVFSFIYCWVLFFALSPCNILIYMFWEMMHW